MKRLAPAAAAAGHEICPFCAQDLSGSPILVHYRAYFSAAYDMLKQAIARETATLSTTHSGEVMAAFERSVRTAVELRQFWSQFTEVPKVNLDTAAIARAWKAAQERVLTALRAKQVGAAGHCKHSPAAGELVAALAGYDTLRAEVARLSDVLQAVNEPDSNRQGKGLRGKPCGVDRGPVRDCRPSRGATDQRSQRCATTM